MRILIIRSARWNIVPCGLKQNFWILRISREMQQSIIRMPRRRGHVLLNTNGLNSARMTEAKLAKLQNNMRNASIEMLKGGGRVGIINACVRLKMVTENRAEFCVEGEEGVGTTVTIRIPCLQEGKTDAESIVSR